MSSGPHSRFIGSGAARTRLTRPFRLWGQVAMGPRDVEAQSWCRTRAPMMPPLGRSSTVFWTCKGNFAEAIQGTAKYSQVRRVRRCLTSALCCIKVGKGGVISLENRDLHRQFLERLLLLVREGGDALQLADERI